jgi:hypothetical protein
MKKTILIFILLSAAILSYAGLSIGKSDELPKVLFFYSPGCHRCAQLKSEVNDLLTNKYQGKFTVEYRDISDIENYKMFLSLQKNLGIERNLITPMIYVGSRFLDGTNSKDEVREAISRLVLNPFDSSAVPASDAKQIDIVSHFRSLGPAIIMSAGFADGINPCAFTTIIFFISFLSVQGYSKKRLLLSGSIFMLSIFVTYILLGAGLFVSLYKLKGFWNVSRIINIIIGAFSIFFGAMCLYDAILYKRTHSSDHLVMQLPKYLKNRIHAAIGSRYRVTKNAPPKGGQNFLAVISAALVVGFLVSILESACTGQLYLPTIVFVLKTAGSRFLAVWYLFLYNIMFMLPLGIIFVLCLVGVSTEVFTRIVGGNMIKIKVIMAVVFFILGIALLSTYVPLARAAEAEEGVRAQAAANSYLYDFGEVKEGAMLKHTFLLKNDTEKTIKIKQITTSCSCTTSNVSKWTIEPGQSTEVEVNFNTTGYPGERTRFSYVNTDNPDNPIIKLEVKAMIKSS